MKANRRERVPTGQEPLEHSSVIDHAPSGVAAPSLAGLSVWLWQRGSERRSSREEKMQRSGFVWISGDLLAPPCG